MARALRPLSSYPTRVVQKIWNITPYDRSVVYSTRKSSPTRLTVVENGRKEVFAIKIEREHSGNYRIAGRWLVLETNPRMEEQYRRLIAAAEAAETVRLDAVAAAEAKPAYKAFIRALTKELGKPRKAEACNRKHLAFKAPSDARCADLITEAKTRGASATLFYARWGRELRVVAGPPTALFALFGWNVWGPNDRELEKAIAALDKAAGVTLDYVDFTSEAFSISLARPLRKAPFEAVLANRLGYRVAWLREDLPKKRLVYGNRPVTWKKLTSRIVDPGTEDD